MDNCDKIEKEFIFRLKDLEKELKYHLDRIEPRPNLLDCYLINVTNDNKCYIIVYKHQLSSYVSHRVEQLYSDVVAELS